MYDDTYYQITDYGMDLLMESGFDSRSKFKRAGKQPVSVLENLLLGKIAYLGAQSVDEFIGLQESDFGDYHVSPDEADRVFKSLNRKGAIESVTDDLKGRL